MYLFNPVLLPYPQVQPLSTVCTLLADDVGTSAELILLSHRNNTLNPTETPHNLGLTTADIIGKARAVGGWLWFGVGLNFEPRYADLVPFNNWLPVFCTFSDSLVTGKLL